VAKKDMNNASKRDIADEHQDSIAGGGGFAVATLVGVKRQSINQS